MIGLTDTVSQATVPKNNWQTPRADGARLIEPELGAWLHWSAANRAELAAVNFDVQGRNLAELSAAARSELLNAAIAATSTYRNVELPAGLSPATAAHAAFYLAGHQPELFHPGVWLKNGLISRAATIESARYARAELQQRANHPLEPAVPRRTAVAINLTVDTDLVKPGAVRVPGGDAARPRWSIVPLDDGHAQVPWEMRAIADHDLLRSWPQRMLEAALPPAAAGCWREVWPLVSERARATGNLGQALAQSRHQYESQFGWKTLELPMSRVQQLPAVRWFLLHLLANLPRFCEVYNAAIAGYRAAHEITSRAHPAPLLENSGEWIEAPFWLWDAANPHRRRVWALWRNDELTLTDRGGAELRLPLSPDRPLDDALAAWNRAEAGGLRLRTKALVTTLVARTLLCDLFVHGIGGAKYDEVTDRIIAAFTGLPAPRYAVATGTLRWPRVAAPCEPRSSERIRGDLRATRFHPERFLNGSLDATASAAIAAKRTWLTTAKTPANAQSRHQAIVAANAALQPLVEPIRNELRNKLASCEQSQQAESVLASRELAFVLHSEARLREFFTG